ncbi:MAG: nitrilase [Acidobacteria bacterium]|nr:nitrilase [Acidobacteriota bacterium]
MIKSLAGSAAASAGSQTLGGAGRTGETEPEPYVALPLQVKCRAVNEAPDAGSARAIMRETIDRLEKQIRASKAFIGPDCRLVVLPEYFLTGFPMGDTFAGWAEKACLEMEGPEYARLGEICRNSSIYLAGNAYELDPAFPGLYFQTSFILDDQGKMVLRYRRLNSMFAPTPHDVWDRYLKVYGLEGAFPVAATPLGRLAAIASEEILYPEVARCLAMRGAEVFVHSNSESTGLECAPKDTAKRARAFENSAYVVSANTGGLEDTAIPAGSADGGSKVVDYQGRVLAEASTGESMSAYAVIDLQALRRHRRRPGMMNMLARQRFELYAQSYASFSFYPANTMLQGAADRSHFLAMQLETIRRLEGKGII